MKKNLPENYWAVSKRKEFWLDFIKKQGPSKTAKIIATMEFEATHDHLTRALNRRGLIERYKLEKSLLERLIFKKNLFGVLITLDLKGLKNINETLGYSKGDRLVIQAVRIIKMAVKRDSDIISRVGGDEFVIILINTNYDGGKKVMAKIKELSEKYQVYFHIHFFEFRIGLPIEDILTKGLETLHSQKKLMKTDKSGRLLADKTTVGEQTNGE